MLVVIEFTAGRYLSINYGHGSLIFTSSQVYIVLACSIPARECSFKF